MRVSFVMIAALASLLLRPSTLAQPAGTWFRTNGPTGGYVDKVAVYPSDPGRILAYTDSGLYRTTNGGMTWQRTPTPDPSYFTAMFISPTSPNTIFLSGLYNGGSTGLLRSTNDGASWEVVANMRLYSIVSDPHNQLRLYAGGDSGAVHVSSNGGLDWTRRYVGSQWRVSAVAIDPAITGVLFAGTTADYSALGDGVFRSTNNGATWTNVALANTNISTILIDPRNPSNVYAATTSGNYIFSRGIYKSTNGGDSWFSSGVGIHPDSSVSALLINPLNPLELYAAMEPNLYWTPDFIALYKTENGGGSWAPVDANIDVHAATCLVSAPSDPDRVFVGGSGLLMGSFSSPDLSNIGVHVVGVRSITLNPANENIVYAIGESVFKSADGGTSWHVINKGLWRGHTIVVDPVNPSVLYAGVYDLNHGGVSKTTDAGQHWFGTALTGEAIQALAVDPVNTAIVYAGGLTDFGQGAVFRSSDGGNTWSMSGSGLNNAIVRCLAVDPQANSTVYAGTINGGVLKSTNQGMNWFPVNTGLPVPAFNYGIVNDIAIDPNHSGLVYAAVSPVGVFKTTNGGITWDSTSSGLTDRDVRAITVDAAQSHFMYAGTWNQGEFESSSGGASWQQMSGGAMVKRITSHALRSQLVQYAGTDRDGVWRHNFLTSGVAEQTVIPTRVSLLQNYPNPFNSNTRIRYSLPAAAQVRLRVFDFLGQQVRELISAFQQPGEHAVVWDGYDDTYRPASSGVYLYRLEVQGRMMTSRMILVK